MITNICFAALFLTLAVPASLRADVTPTDVKKGAEEKRRTVEKNTRQAGEKATEDRSGDATKAAPKKKKRSFFGDNELSRDRSLPAGEKVPMTDDKPRPKKSLSEQLRKDRSLDGK